MEIKTKFNVGDVVCCISAIYGTRYIGKREERCAVWFISNENFKIRYFSVGNVYDGENSKITISYSSEIVGSFKEEDVFLTKEQAQKECDRRNEQK